MNPPPHNPYEPGNPWDPNNPGNNNPGQNQNWQQNPWQQNPYQQPNYQQPNYQQNWQQNPYQQSPYNPFIPGGQLDLPNASTVLVLGILSILAAFCYGIPGIIMGIIAASLSGTPKSLYENNPGGYTASSYNNLKAGRVCGIIGLSLGGLFLLIILIAALADM